MKLDWLLTESNSREYNTDQTSWHSTYGTCFLDLYMWFSRVRLKKYKLKKYLYKKEGKKNEFQSAAVVVSSFRPYLCELANISTSPIIHLVCPPKFCITFVFHFYRVLRPMHTRDFAPGAYSRGSPREQSSSVCTNACSWVYFIFGSIISTLQNAPRYLTG